MDPPRSFPVCLSVTAAQLGHEWARLMRELGERDPGALAACRDVAAPEVHPLFYVIAGAIEDWERR